MSALLMMRRSVQRMIPAQAGSFQPSSVLSSQLVGRWVPSSSSSSDESRRGYWQEVIRRRKDRTTGKLQYEDPGRVAKRFQESRRGSDGEILLNIHLWNEKHEKPWMKKKRMASLRQYNKDKQHVLDLAKYIEFVQENDTSSSSSSDKK